MRRSSRHAMACRARRIIPARRRIAIRLREPRRRRTRRPIHAVEFVAQPRIHPHRRNETDRLAGAGVDDQATVVALLVQHRDGVDPAAPEHRAELGKALLAQDARNFVGGEDDGVVAIGTGSGGPTYAPR